MKRIFCIILVLTAVFSCLTACNFAEGLTNTLEDKSESAAKIEEMMAALSENRISDAKALMHPEADENADAGLQQMIDYLDGRKAVSMTLSGINVSVSSGTNGKENKENLAYTVNLSDGSVISINALYLANDVGAGFLYFQLVLGVI